ACHGPLDALDDGRGRAAVVLELLGAVVDLDAGALAQVLVVGALVGVLEAAPAADVVDQDGPVVGATGLHVVDHLPQRVAAGDAEAALALVGVGADDLEAAAPGVVADDVLLVDGGVLLVLGGHPAVLGRPGGGGRCCGRAHGSHGSGETCRGSRATWTHS